MAVNHPGSTPERGHVNSARRTPHRGGRFGAVTGRSVPTGDNTAGIPALVQACDDEPESRLHEGAGPRPALSGLGRQG
ncbi:hypothetical protein GCM10027294_31240 [Marinactinospora endophytica]